ncbi:MAG: ROK family protein [Cetobacterium sp.]
MYQIEHKNKNNLDFLNFLYKNKKISISKTSKDLDLTYPTVKRLVDDFIEEGIILTGEKEALSTGRSAFTFNLNLNKFYSIGVHFELNKMNFILIDILGDIKKESTILNISYKDTNFLKNLIDIFREFYNSIDKTTKLKILGIGISFPGIVDSESLFIIDSINLELRNLNLGIAFKEFHDNIFLENDANACVYSENIIGKGTELKDFAVISIGSGMGAGLYLKEKLYHGNKYLSGEFGHVTIDYNGKVCNCGNRGCWELYVSETAIESEFKNLNLENIFDQNKNPEFVQNYIKFFSIGLKNIIFSFDIKNIIISGDVSKYIEKYRDDIILEVQKNQYLRNYELNLLFSDMNRKSSVLGAALIPVSNYFNLVY